MRTQVLLDRLCEELTRNCGDALAAARSCGVSLQFVRAWAKDDKVTADILQEATLVGSQGLVSAAIQRAVDGVDEDVYYKGVVVGQKRLYSDTLLQTLLKAKVEDFKQNAENAPQVTVNIANLMPRANSYEEWLTMRDATNQAALPKPEAAPMEVIDADFKAIEPAFAGINL